MTAAAGAAAGRFAGGYLPAAPPPGRRLRLFCFHHAGGGASAFAGWPALLGPQVTVLPVQLPGREYRVREPRIVEMAELVDDLVRHLAGQLRPPYAFYGHSMGAIVAYDLAVRLRAEGRDDPECLLVGAYPAPHLPAVLTAAQDMSDADLGRLLVDVGGMSAALLDYPDWLRAAVSLVRDDLRVCFSHVHRPGTVLPYPLHVFTGTADPLLPPADAAAWRPHASSCQVHQIPGGHFFTRDSTAAFIHRLAAVLAASRAGWAGSWPPDPDSLRPPRGTPLRGAPLPAAGGTPRGLLP